MTDSDIRCSYSINSWRRQPSYLMYPPAYLPVSQLLTQIPPIQRMALRKARKARKKQLVARTMKSTAPPILNLPRTMLIISCSHGCLSQTFTAWYFLSRSKLANIESWRSLESVTRNFFTFFNARCKYGRMFSPHVFLFNQTSRPFILWAKDLNQVNQLWNISTIVHCA